MELLDSVRQTISLYWGEIFGKQIYEALQGDIVEAILDKANIVSEDNYYKNILDGHSFKVEKDNLSNYHAIFQEVKEGIGFEEDIDFYITGDSSINAYCIPSRKKGKAHIMNVNSGLINIMTDNELRFVIGHEFGHLIDTSNHVKELVNFVYPQGASTPLALVNKIRIWRQLAELSADRCGYIACPDLETCVSAFFKMSSGLDFQKMGLNFETFIADNTRKLREFRDSGGINVASHPTNLIRIEALKHFSQHEIFYEKGGLSSDEIESLMLPLVEILICLSDNQLDYYIAQYAVSLGIMLGNVDGDISKAEIESILGNLASVYVFPSDYLEKVSKMDDKEIGKLYTESVGYILETHPEMRSSMLNYAIGLVLSDKRINTNEVDLVFAIGNNLGFSEQEIAQMFAGSIQASFTPDMLAIS